MARRRTKYVYVPPPGWTITLETRINRRVVTKGTELSIKGERGRFCFQRLVETDKGSRWIDVIGGPKGARKYRSFYPERVKKVHRINRLRENLT